MRSDTITVNGRIVEVPTTPINYRATFSSLLRPRVRVEGDLLTLELDRGMRPFGALLLVWGLAAASVGVAAVVHKWDPIAKLVFLGQGAFLPFMGLLFVLLPSRHEFDRGEGVYRRRSVVSPAERPLTEVVAVQAMRGRVAERTTEGGGTSSWQTYELNLVVATGRVRREAVTCTIDDNWVAEAGRAVSEFLGVPFLCRLVAEPHS